MAIPLVVGVTGHRRLRPEDDAVLRAAVRRELQALQTRCPHTPIKLLTGLAEGADTLCAEEAAALGIAYSAVLPAEKDVFLADFEGEAKERFLALYEKAETVIVAPSVEPTETSRNYRFRQVGIYLVEHSHVLLALWDGGEAKSGGCGTAEVVDMLVNGSYAPQKGLPLRSLDNECLVCIRAPRAGAVDAAAGELTRKGAETVLDKTEEFNALAAEKSGHGHALFPETKKLGETEQKLQTLYLTASGLSGRFAKTYRRVLKLLAAASTVIAAAYLLYDQLSLLWMLLVCGVVLALAWLCRRYAVKSDCHRRYIEYRELAECLRVQAYLRYAGSALDVKNVFPAAQQDGTPWIFSALCGVSIYPADGGAADILSDWVLGQRDYHRSARGKTARDKARNDRLVCIAAVVSVCLYAVLIAGDLFGASMEPRSYELWYTVIKVALGSVSVGTLFLSNYYGKLSLSRKLADHERMERFFGRMAAQLRRCGQTDELLEALAREELIENSNWCAYQSDNAPTLDL